MRICHIIEPSGGGSGRVVLDLIQAGISAGDEITLVYSPLRAEENFVRAAVALGDKLHRLPLEMKRSVGPHDLGTLYRFWRLMRSAGPFDIIHSHSSKAGAICRIAGLALPGAQVYTPHAFVTMSPNGSRLFGMIERALGWLTNAIICVSAGEMRHAQEALHIRKSVLHYIPNGIELAYPATRATARKALNIDGFVFGFVGRFAEQKNLPRLLAAFKIAAASRPDAQLVIAGDGPVHPAPSDRVRIVRGYNGRDIIPAFDCLVCSSDYEGFPIVFLEALAAGVPIVATPVGGTHEAIGEDYAGIIAKDFRAESLGEAMAKLGGLDAKHYATFSANARSKAEAFSMPGIYEQIKSLYKSLLNVTDMKQ